jgi:putative aldouronate transport system substrate-binding protein
MKKVRIPFLLVAIVMIIAMVGCQAATPTAAPSAATTTAPTASADAASAAPETKGPVTKITYYRPGIALKALTNFSDAYWVKELEKKMNISIDFQGPKTTDDYNQAAALMLASGTLTDMFYYDFSKYNGGVTGGINDGIVVNVSADAKYKAEMPNWFAILDKYPNIRKSATLDDGTSCIFDQVEMTSARMAYWGEGIRVDWLKKLNLQMPTTMDELYNVLVAFRDGDPNGNGKKDEIPMTDYNLNGGQFFFTIMDYCAPFGLLYQEAQQDPSNPGKVNYWINVNDGKNFQDLVTTLNKWYKEKLLDADFATQDGTAQDAKVTNDTVGVLHIWPSNFNIYNTALQKKTATADFEGLGCLVGEANKAYTANSAMVKVANGSLGTFVTTQAVKDNTVDTCLKLLDYLYSDEGSDLQNWGVEGVSYTVGSDGKKAWTDTIAKDPDMLINDKVNAYALPTFGDWPKVMSYDAWASIELNTAASTAAHDLWAKGDTGLCLPNLTLSATEAADYAKIMADVNTAISENFIKFIIGTRPLSEVPDLVKQCQSLGIAKAMAMYQSAYDRYNAK